jgi:hypothetical protein
VAYVLAMAFTLVYTGEHFVIDEFVGWTYAAVVFVVGSRLLDRWNIRRHRLASPIGGNSAPIVENSRVLERT